ncbi:hypothetical protein ACYOEI_17485 [Singulisphaera rosea]
MNSPNTYFRGTELPRLLVLTVILAGGMAFLWQYLYSGQLVGEPEAVAAVPITPIVPDRSVEFETVTDKTSLGLRDMAAYKKLLDQAKGKTPDVLARESRRDVLSIQVWERPKDYRGVPIHILGTVLRAMTYESQLSKTGRLYEAWMVTSDSQRNPYVCVFEDAPKGFPIGDNLSERVVFNGYFLKLMKYRSGKDLGFYTSPVLIGKIGWSPPEVPKGGERGGAKTWMAIAVGAMFVLSLLRWMSGLRRTLAIRQRPSLLHERPNEEISPEALAAWADEQAMQNEEDPEGDEGEPPLPR